MKNWKELVGAAERMIHRNAPQILTSLGVAGMLTAIVFAVGATPKAMRLLDEKKKKDGVNKLTPLETVKTAGPCYIPTAIAAAASTACLIGANNVNGHRNAALATAYSLSESALRTYQEKTTELVGEKKEGEIRDASAKQRLENGLRSNPTIFVTGNGKVHCYDIISEKVFMSDMETIRKAQNDINDRINDEMYVRYNDFLALIGAPPMKTGDDLGFNVNNKMNFLPDHALIDGIPYLVIDHYNNPTPNFREY